MNRSSSYGWLIAIVLLISLGLRVAVSLGQPLIGHTLNDDALSHLLVTSVALGQTPVSAHKFLPIFTYGNELDRDIDDLPGAAARDREGRYYYTSFPPGAFALSYFGERLLAPALLAAGWSEEQSRIDALRLLSALLGSVAALTLAGLLHAIALEKVIRTPECSDVSSLQGSELSAVVGLLFFVSTFEFSKSYGVSLWAQQYHFILIVVLIFLFVRGHLITFAGLLLLGGLLEWTSYVVAGGFFLLSAFYWHQRGAKWMGAIALSVLAAIGLLFFWQTRNLALADILANLARRSTARTGYSPHGLAWLGIAYAISIGPAVAILLLWCGAFVRFGRKTAYIWPCKNGLFSTQPSIIVVTVVVIAVSCLENILLVNHATEYSFDRLKGMALIAVLMVVLMPMVSRAVVAISCALFFVGALVNAAILGLPVHTNADQYQHLRNLFRPLAEMDPQHRAVRYATTRVRGAAIYYSGGNIVELPYSGVLSDTLDLVRRDLTMRHVQEGILVNIDDEALILPGAGSHLQGTQIGIGGVSILNALKGLLGWPVPPLTPMEVIYCRIDAAADSTSACYSRLL